MTYPTGTPVHTITLAGDDHDQMGQSHVLVYLGEDGEVATKNFDDYRACQRFANMVLDFGGRILAVVEGEHDYTTGERSVWTR